MADDPWYNQGLRFSCTQCGKCCTGSPGYVWVTEDEMRDMANMLGLSLELFKRKYTRFRNGRYSLIEMKSRNYEWVSRL